MDVRAMASAGFSTPCPPVLRQRGAAEFVALGPGRHCARSAGQEPLLDEHTAVSYTHLTLPTILLVEIS
eukprot:863507-Pyramimonas_sp.AAC.1